MIPLKAIRIYIVGNSPYFIILVKPKLGNIYIQWDGMVYSYGSNGNTPDPSSEPILVPIILQLGGGCKCIPGQREQEEEECEPKGKGKGPKARDFKVMAVDCHFQCVCTWGEGVHRVGNHQHTHRAFWGIDK
jgi:hypothetical protein